MIRVLTYPSKKLDSYLKKLLSRVEEYPSKLEKYVQKIGKEVKKLGDKALIEYTKRFDGVILTSEELRVKEEEIERAYKVIDRELLSAIRYAINKIRRFHEKALPLSWFEDYEDGIILGQLVRPIERAGLYIPGGKGGETPLISTVLMTAVPAKIAASQETCWRFPLQGLTVPSSSSHVVMLLTKGNSELTEIYKVGWPRSIFALAYGTEFLSRRWISSVVQGTFM